MSGICGAWTFDGSDPDLTPVLAQLERRGPDGTHRWADGPIALGHTLLATTPEALVEIFPLTEPASGCTITADVRLDNRDELIAALDLGGVTRTIGDGELILRAYLKWGEECPTHLLGDFAFAIWDPRAQRLFCARDHMGMRQFNYCHLAGEAFVFATEAEALVAHRHVPKRINESRIADFLDDMEGIDFTSTFYEHVFRLPPAHVLTVDRNGQSLRPYWQLIPDPAPKLDSDQAYADAFLVVFTEAVRCRLRSAGPVGSMLSGGLDSGSIAAVAAGLLSTAGEGPLRTLSAIGPDPDNCAESSAIREVLGLKGIDATLIDHSSLGRMLSELWQLEGETGEPFEHHMTLIRAVYLSARQRGIRVVLDGVAGDVVLTSANRVAEHLRRGRINSAWKDACGQQAYWKIPKYRFRSFFAGAWVAYVPNVIRRARRQLSWRVADAAAGLGRAMNSGFAHRVDLRARRAVFRSRIALHDLPNIDRRTEAISHPHLTVARERYDRTAAAVGIEPRDPFMDIRVIQFCLSLPADQMQRNGLPKYILRRATAGLLPDSIRWRLGKEHLGWSFTQQLFGEFPGWRASLEDARPLISPYVRFPRHNPNARPHVLEREFRLYVLARWMERNQPLNR